MKRRDFLRRIAVGTGVILAGSRWAQAGLDVLGEPFSVDDLELVGKKKPGLFGDNYNLRQRASEAFADMRSDAAGSGIALFSVSSYRSFEYQKGIWNRKFRRLTRRGLSRERAVKDIIRYSAIPGTSRHHWGADLDLTDTSRPHDGDILQAGHFRKGGVFEALGNWLARNANKYGFYETYTDDPDRTGFEFEPWHLSFAELSIPLLARYMAVELKDHLSDSSIEGSESFTPEFIANYRRDHILGINPRLIPAGPD